MTLNSSILGRQTWEVPSYNVPLWIGRSHSYCVVVPVINEGARIKSLLSRMMTHKISELADIIIVDGGSSDGSLPDELLSIGRVSGLLVKTGPGKLSAQLRSAYAFALDNDYQGIITIDGNDKDDPEAIPRFIEALRRGVDFIQASRYIAGGLAENTPVLRDFAIRYIHAPLLSFFSGFHWTDTTQGFRAYSKKMLIDARLAPFRNVFKEYELLAYLSFRAPKLGYQCIELPAVRRYPASGNIPTKITGIKGNWLILKVLLKTCLGVYNPT